MTFDFSGITRLAVDLGDAAEKVFPLAAKALEVTAGHVKDDWREDAEGHNIDGSARAYPFAIDYEMDLDTDGQISAVIGPSLDKPQGALGIVEDAGGGIRSAPRRSHEKAAAKNQADFEKGILQAGLDALE